MASGLEHAFFYPSENHDRIYNAASFEYWLKKFFTSGVFAGDLQVTANDDMTVTMSGGYANVDGKVRFFEESQVLQLETANNWDYDRIDTIVVERNDTLRDVDVKVVTGTYSRDPEPTAPIRGNGIYQLVVAQVKVVHGAVRIVQADITDTRMSSDVCGIVTGAVEQVDFSQISAQFDSFMEVHKKKVAEDYTAYTDEIAAFESQAEESFTAWFEKIRDQLSTDAAGKLQNQIDALKDGISVSNNTLYLP